MIIEEPENTCNDKNNHTEEAVLENKEMSENDFAVEEQAKLVLPKFEDMFKEDDLIPQEHLGNVLEIYTFFQYFDSVLDGPIFDIEELWTSFFYSGPDFLELIHDMHLAIVNLWIKSLFTNRTAFETYQTKNGHSIFLMIYAIYFKEKFRNLVMRVIWPDLVSELAKIHGSETEKEEISRILGGTTINNYNAMSTGDKIKVMLFLMRVSGRLSVLKELHQTKSDRMQELTKKKVSLFNKLKVLKAERLESKTKLDALELEVVELENKQKEGISSLSRTDLHETVTGLNQLRSKRSKANREFSKIDGQFNKIEKELKNVRRELPMSVHLAKLLGYDGEGNTYWAFRFDNSRIYKCDRNQQYKVSKGTFKNLQDSLNEESEYEANIKKRLTHLIELDVLSINENNQNEIQSQNKTAKVEDYYADVFDYSSAFKYKSKRGGSRKVIKKPLELKFDEFFDFLMNYEFKNLLSNEFFRDFVFYMDKELTIYLNLRNSYWIEEKDRAAFVNKLTQMNLLEEYIEFVKKMENQFATIITEIEEEPEEEEPDQSKNDNKMEIEAQANDDEDEDDDEEEIDFKRRKNVMTIERETETKPEANIIKKGGTLKFWNYYMYRSKIMWRDYIEKLNKPSNIFLALMVFGTNLFRFLVNKTEKFLENERKEEELINREKEINDLNATCGYKQESGVRTRFSLRRQRLASKKKKTNCNECRRTTNDNDLSCFSCNSYFHFSCLGIKKTGNYSEWRCDSCLDKIATKRMTRSLRRKLKYYA